MTRNNLEIVLSDLFGSLTEETTKFKLLKLDTSETCWYYGRNEEGHHTICYYSTIPFPSLPKLNTKSIHLVVKKGDCKEDNYLYFILQNYNELPLFLELMADIIINSLNYQTELERSNAIIERFQAWKELLKHDVDEIFITQGIFGEMITILDLFEKYKPDQVISSWSGPELQKHDFVFPDTWVETKTTKTSKECVRISSLDQLEGPNDGILYVVKVDISRKSDEGMSLLELYNMVLNKLNNYPQAKNEFVNKVIDFKYRSYMLRESIRFIVTGKLIFDVPVNDNDFPRLYTSYARSGLKNVSYDVDLASLKYWERKNIYG